MVRQIDLNDVSDDPLMAASDLMRDMTHADGKCPINFRQAVGMIQTLSAGKELPDHLCRFLSPDTLYYLIVHRKFHAKSLSLARQAASESSHPDHFLGCAPRQSNDRAPAA